MKLIYLVFIVLGLAWACSGAGGDSLTASGEPDGRQLYKTYCVACHGINGNMGGNGAYDLSRSPLSPEERVQVITHGRNSMTPFKSLLSPEQIQAVAGYTLELTKTE